MCGICGFTGFGDADILASMTETMIHRGPDACGLWHAAQEAVYLGHRRLSIIDLSSGAQPLCFMVRNIGRGDSIKRHYVG